MTRVANHRPAAANRRPEPDAQPAATGDSGVSRAWTTAPVATRSPAPGAYFQPQYRTTGPVIQRSPLSDQVQAAWTAEPTFEALLARLARPDVQAAQADADVDTLVARLLSGRTEDLWVAERIRRGELGRTKGPARRAIQAVFFRGVSSRRALVIAGVHGSERQGIEVAQMLIRDLGTAQPHFTVIVVPSLFPDNAAAGAFGSREGTTPTNRNFPRADQDLAAASGRDARGRSLLPENVMLLELMERFQPERIISIHGTWRAGSAGVFFDPRQPTDAERQAAWEWAAERAAAHRPSRGDLHSEGGAEAVTSELRDLYYKQRLEQLTTTATTTDRDLSVTAAGQIHAATTSIIGREDRKTWGREREASAATSAEVGGRIAHPSIAGNIGATGKIDHANWSGTGTGGVSFGQYAPARGMSVFTVEPPINRNTGDYLTKKDPGVDQAERKLELQAYTDAVRTVLLGR